MTDRISNLTNHLLSDNWYTLRKYAYDYRRSDGTWERQEREAYDRGNGAAILLYNPERETFLLTRQFRLPTFVNGNPGGFLTEVCAGILDDLDPEACIRKETMEETGVAIERVEKVCEAYMSPGSVTEILHFFIGEYTDRDRTGTGGGLDAEQEEIETLEIPVASARTMLRRGEFRDAKTILLLQHFFLRQALSEG